MLGDLSHAMLDAANGLQKRVHRAQREPPSRPVRRAQNGLHAVGDGDGGLDVDHGRQTLDRVERPEKIPNGPWLRLFVTRRCFDLEELGVRELELLFDLGQVRGEKLFELEPLRQGDARVGAPTRETTSPRISAGEKGLVMNRLAPAASALVR